MLKEKILNLIKSQKAIPFSLFMEMSAYDQSTTKDINTNEGYYINKDPLGKKGDFITAPEISQIFGELIAIFLLDTWYKLGSPQKIHLIELGAGRGTLLADILRVWHKTVGSIQGLQIHIIETNKQLIERQKIALSTYKDVMVWHTAIDELINTIKAPVLIYSNEFFDCLPVKQTVFTDKQWYELYVSHQEQELIPIFYPIMLGQIHNNVLEGTIIESSPQANAIFTTALDIIKSNTGAMLTIDYGEVASTGVNSIRGYKNHQLLDINEILHHAGDVDITYNVKFQELQKIANNKLLDTYNIITQRDFLEKLGMQYRVQKIMNTIKVAELQEDFKSRVNILLNPHEMGEKFKVMLVSHGVNNLSVFNKINHGR